MIAGKIKHDGMGLSFCKKRLLLNTLTGVLSGQEPDGELGAGDAGHVFSFYFRFQGFRRRWEGGKKPPAAGADGGRYC